MLLLLAWLLLAVTSVRHKSLTYDEPHHVAYGLQLLHGDADRFDDSKMPVSALNALPLRMAEALPDGGLRRALSTPLAKRWATILAGALLGLLLWQWARQLYGAFAGVLALALYVFEPNLLAHARLATTDLYATLTTTLVLYCAWRVSRGGGWRWGAATALALGLALVAKYSGVFLLPLLGLLGLLRWGPLALEALRRRDRERLRRQTLRATGAIALLGVGSLLVVNAAFLFRRTGTPLSKYPFRSATFQDLQAQAGALAELPLPVPYPWLEGLDWVRLREQTGDGYGMRYLRGELREAGGFRGYYLWTWLLKVPLATQLLVLAALVAWLTRRRRFAFRRDEAFLLVPVAFFWVYLNLLFGAQMGIRFLLISFPPLLVFTSSLAAQPPRLPRPARLALAGGVAAAAASVLAYFPHYISYFNELVPRGEGWRYLADSNLDWGQNHWYLQRWLAQHPDALLNPYRPRAGTVVVAVNNFTGITRDTRFRWLRESGLEPVGHIAHSFLVFEVPPEVADHAAGMAPRGPWVESPGLPGFRAKVRITQRGQPPLWGAPVAHCPARTLCVAGALEDVPEVLVRVVQASRGRHRLSIIRFTPARVEAWIEHRATGEVTAYELPAVPPASRVLTGLVDRAAFMP
ncbi:MAG TPA: glycosyltransferase family 39 protein [Thermoanaerobaculia bacterium]|nr:glycosyltransferase family 39 protein [Thermoanaerobaculia bacterium]